MLQARTAGEHPAWSFSQKRSRFVQKFWSILFGATMLGALLLFIVAFFVPGWWLPKDVSTFGHDIDVLFNLISWITGFFFVLTEAILVYAMYRFTSRPGRK